MSYTASSHLTLLESTLHGAQAHLSATVTKKDTRQHKSSVPCSSPPIKAVADSFAHLADNNAAQRAADAAPPRPHHDGPRHTFKTTEPALIHLEGGTLPHRVPRGRRRPVRRDAAGHERRGERAGNENLKVGRLVRPRRLQIDAVSGQGSRRTIVSAAACPSSTTGRRARSSAARRRRRT